MKILFAGPSIAGLRIPDGISVRGPAVQGDITQATLEGVNAIGLIDGRFDNIASVWHKEILFALSQGVHVCGAASMGALRAAECDRFGMVGIGVIYTRYATGELDDDAAVAQLHAPHELGYTGITEPLVNVEATISMLRENRTLNAREAEELLTAAGRLNFKNRTYRKMVDRLRVSSERRAQIAAAIEAGKIDIKQRDAQELIGHVMHLPDERGSMPSWRLALTACFQSTLRRSHATLVSV